MSNTCYVGVTMGDPAGIGPEIVCKSLREAALYEHCCPVVIGSREPIERILAVLGYPVMVRTIETPEDGIYNIDTLNLIELPLDYAYQPGVLDAGNGRAAIAYMKRAHELLCEGKISAIACAPCHKGAMKLAGSPYTGATELFAHFAGDVKTSTVIQQGGCYIFQLTTHVPLKKAIEMLTVERVRDFIVTSYRTLQAWGIEHPRLALSGMNPHAGDNGAIGTEDQDILLRAIEEASAEVGFVDGPVAADAVFMKGYNGCYDGVIGLFHDTVNIAVKLMDNYMPSVVISAGLPFVRTTVAHGVGYDIAYKGLANHEKMRNCIIAAAEISARQNRTNA